MHSGTERFSVTFDQTQLALIILFLLIGKPGCIVVMDRVRILCQAHGTGVVVTRAKISLRINADAFDLLMRIILLETFFQQVIRRVMRTRQRVEAAVRIDEGDVFIDVAHGFDMRIAFCGTEPQSQRDKLAVLEAHERLVLQQRIHIADDFHIRIQVDATLCVDDIQTGIVRHESPFLDFIGFLHVAVFSYVIVAFVPFDDFVIRTELPPAFDAGFVFFRNRRAAEPTVMDDFRYLRHEFPLSFSFICAALF